LGLSKHQEILKKSLVPTKILSSKTVFITANRFLKDHVTLNTGLMAAENSALPSQD